MKKQPMILALLLVLGLAGGGLLLLSQGPAGSQDDPFARSPRTPPPSPQPTPTAAETAAPTPATPAPTPPATSSEVLLREPPPAAEAPRDLLEVRCVDQTTRLPLEGVTVVVTRIGQEVARATSDSEGLAVARGLAPEENVHATATHPLARAPVSFGPLIPAQTGRVTVAIPVPRPVILLGRLTDDRGLPAAGAEVALLPFPLPTGREVPERSARGEADGSFRWQIPPGTWKGEARAPGHEPLALGPLTVRGGDTLDLGTLALERQALLSGRLLLSGVRPDLVRVVLELPGKVVRRLTPELTGDRYQLGVPPGRLRLRLQAEQPGDPPVGEWQDLTLAPGEQRTDLDLAFGEVPVAVSGLVLDVSDQPLPWAEVTAGPLAVETDEQGRFVLRGLAQPLPVKVTAQGYVTQEVVPESLPAQVELRLDAAGSLTGRLLADEAQTISHTTVVAVEAPLDGDGDGEIYPIVLSQDDLGAFQIDLPAGRYVVVVEGPSGATRRSQPVVIEPGRPTDMGSVRIP